MMVNDSKKIDIAKSSAAAVLKMFAELGVTATLVGSLKVGRFSDFSDVDFLVESCPKHLKYRLESFVEDLMGTIKFDLIYADEAPAHILKKMTVYSPATHINA
jgi:predicted nucleotidyltransferase